MAQIGDILFLLARVVTMERCVGLSLFSDQLSHSVVAFNETRCKSTRESNWTVNL